MGWGSAPVNLPNQDGLEMKLLSLRRGVPANFLNDAKNNEEAASWIAALAELTAAKPEFRPMGKKTMADWNKKAAMFRAEADVFAKAIADRDLKAVQKGAQAVLATCTNCHIVYKE